VKDGTECKNPGKPVVAATLEKALTYESAEPLVWDREVGGSNPLALGSLRALLLRLSATITSEI